VTASSCFADLTTHNHRKHPLHGGQCAWPETNCWVDLWIEVVGVMGLQPEAMLGFTVAQDFEGDQFTFFKIPFEDLEALYGLKVQELALYDPVERHVDLQLQRGRLCLIEVDPYYLPDTRELTYRLHHGKTTIAINRLDIPGKRIEYIHNTQYLMLEGEDYDGLFKTDAPADQPYLPYVEFAKFGARPQGDPKVMARDILRRRLAQRPAANPIAAYQQVFEAQAKAMAPRGPDFFDHYAFNTLRQLGSNFQLLSSHLTWLEGAPSDGSGSAQTIAETAKMAQFRLARAGARGKGFDTLPAALQPAADAYDVLFDYLKRYA
jgi:hypothetical protein